MDEPLSNLDALLRLEMRLTLKELQTSLKETFIYATHDQVEALSMGDRIAILDNGKLQQIGIPGEIYRYPENSLVATVFLFYISQIPIPSVILDTFNVAVVVFAGVVIRQRARELTVEEKTTFWEFSLDILAVPMAKIGKWLAEKWREWNIVSVLFTALFDMPFLAFIGFLEGWSSFLKEKKAEIH